LISKLDDDDEESRRELETLAAGLKVYTSWHAIESLQVCRESCGGQGYLAVNRFGALKADADVFATFEGSNPVLLQLVAKGLLTGYRNQFSGNKFFGIVKFLTNKAAIVLTEQNPLATRNVDPSHLRDPEFHLSALRYREDSLLVSAARRLKSRLDKKMDSFQAFNEVQDHLCTLATAHVERRILESFQRAVEGAPNYGIKDVLGKLCALFALTRMEKDAGWFLESGLLEPVKSKAIRSQTLQLCAELRPHARGLVDAFAFPDKILSAPIALGEQPA
jgi:acyl-CoA oxidase